MEIASLFFLASLGFCSTVVVAIEFQNRSSSSNSDIAPGSVALAYCLLRAFCGVLFPLDPQPLLIKVSFSQRIIKGLLAIELSCSLSSAE
jgi:hypothetical protein